MRSSNSSWKSIADAFANEGASVTSERGIRRLVEEFQARLTANAVTKRLENSDPD